jgi:hypothetical protein
MSNETEAMLPRIAARAEVRGAVVKNTIFYPYLVMIVALLTAGAINTYAQLALVSASLRPCAIFAPNAVTNKQYRLETSRIDPLSPSDIASTNRFQLTATLNRIYTDASLSGPRLGLSLVPGYPLGTCRVNWIEDEITSGYRLQSASNLAAPTWQDHSVQANKNSRITTIPSNQVSAEKSQFFRLVKP